MIFPTGLNDDVIVLGFGTHTPSSLLYIHNGRGIQTTSTACIEGVSFSHLHVVYLINTPSVLSRLICKFNPPTDGPTMLIMIGGPSMMFRTEFTPRPYFRTEHKEGNRHWEQNGR